MPPGLTFPTIKAQPRTDSGPVLCESPEADDVKTLFVRHTNGAPRYCTSGARPSMPPFYICPVSSKTALTTSTQHNVLCQYDMLLLHRHCQQSAANQLMRAICVDFINLLGNVTEKHMCLQPVFSALKKRVFFGDPLAWSNSRAHPSGQTSYLLSPAKLYSQACLPEPQAQSHINRTKRVQLQEQKYQSIGRSCQNKWTASPPVAMTEFVLQFMGLREERAQQPSTAQHSTGQSFKDG